MIAKALKCERCSAYLRPSKAVDGIVACDFCSLEHMLLDDHASHERAESRQIGLAELLGGIIDPLGVPR